MKKIIYLGEVLFWLAMVIAAAMLVSGMTMSVLDVVHDDSRPLEPVTIHCEDGMCTSDYGCTGTVIEVIKCLDEIIEEMEGMNYGS